MPYVVLDGTGSYTVGDWKFLPGATPCDDENVLQEILAENLDWVTVRDSLEVPQPPQPPAPEPPKSVVFDKFQGRDGKWYFHMPPSEGRPVRQSDPFDSEEDADAAIEVEKNKIPLAADLAAEVKGAQPLADTAGDGALSSQDVASGVTYPCRAEGCDKISKSKGARTNHERVVHGGKIAETPEVAPPAPIGPEPELTDTVTEPRNVVAETVGAIGEPAEGI